MYFKIEGELDVAKMLSTHDGIDLEKFCEQLLSNNNQIVKTYTSSQVEQWEGYYREMHPCQILNEDVVQSEVTDEDIKQIFNRFFKPMAVDACPLTIIDPYIFATGTNISLFVDILSANVQSKKVRFVTNSRNSDTSVKENIYTQLTNMGFTVDIVDRTDIHDRYWYTRIKGFYCGTSFNGISRKTTMINLFPDQDLSDIISKFGILT